MNARAREKETWHELWGLYCGGITLGQRIFLLESDRLLSRLGPVAIQVRTGGEGADSRVAESVCSRAVTSGCDVEMTSWSDVFGGGHLEEGGATAGALHSFFFFSESCKNSAIAQVFLKFLR